MIGSKKRLRLMAVTCMVPAGASIAGCESGSDAQSSADQFAADAASNQALFDNVIGSLLQLDARVDMGLETEVRVVSPRQTTDGEPAKATTRESQPGSGRFDIVEIVSENAQFVTNGVKEQDILRFVADPQNFDSEYLRQLELQGKEIPEGPQEVRDRIVEVLDENRVRIARGVPVKIEPAITIEVLRAKRARQKYLEEKLSAWLRTGEPAVAWQPTPDEATLNQIVNRLNQWVRARQGNDSTDGWQLDSLVETLPPALRSMPAYEDLSATEFNYEDGRLMQEAVWLRDIAANVTMVGDYPGLDDVRLRKAYELFDWVVRHVQLEPDDDVSIRQNRPWQTLLYGLGTAQQRAWVFTLLARQQGLDVVVLKPQSGKKRVGFLCGLLIDDNIYLFDTMLGMPLPGKDGEGVATLRDAIEDESILDFVSNSLQAAHGDETDDAKQSQPVEYYSEDDLKQVDAWVEGSPNYLARRMLDVENQLIGSRKFVLTARPSLIAKVAETHPNVVSAKLWPIAGETLLVQSNLTKDDRKVVANRFGMFCWRPKLWKGRVLQFQGIYNDVLPGDSAKGLVNAKDGAKSFYLDGRPTAARVREADVPEHFKKMWFDQKLHSSYWIALILMDEGLWREAQDWLQVRVLTAFRNSQFTPGAIYNLGRCYEADGRITKAIATYAEDKTSPQRFGNQLRSKWLRVIHPKKDEASPPTPLDDEPQDKEEESKTENDDELRNEEAPVE